MKNWKLVLGVLCLVVVLLIAGCGKKSPSTKPKPDPEPGDKEVQIFLETFDKIETPTNIKEDQSLLDNPDSFDPGNIPVDYLWAGREKGALSMDNGTETEPGPNAPRVAILVPELDKATKPVLKVTAKNTSGNEIYLYVGNKYIASGNLGEDGHRAHDVCTISANSPYKVYTIPLNEAWLASNLIQLRPTIIGQDGKNTSNGAAGLVIDQIEIVAESTTAKLNYELVVEITGQGTVDPGSGTYKAGETVTLQATPEDGWTFGAWGGDIEDATVSGDQITFKMYGDRNITAEFVEASTKYSLIVNYDEEMGSVSVVPQKEEYSPGDTVTLTATAADGYEFKLWSGGLESTENPLEITITGDITITAEFAVKLSLPPVGEGDLELNVTTSYDELTALELPAEYKGFTIGDGLSFDKQNRIFDGVEYTQRIKTNGSGPINSGKHRTLIFNAKAGQVITVLANPSSDSGTQRQLVVAPYDEIEKSYGESVFTSPYLGPAAELTYVSYTFTEDGQYALYSLQNVNIFYVSVTTP